MLNYILEACNYIVNKKLIYFILFITIIYCFTAYNSSGFHQPDEHFQIIEFANYKLGNTKPQDLSWEFKAEIRPTIQPALTYLII